MYGNSTVAGSLQHDELVVRDVFRPTGAATVIAYDRPAATISFSNRPGRIVSDTGEQRQECTIRNELSLLHRSANFDLVGLETLDPICLTAEEAQSGKWRVLLED